MLKQVKITDFFPLGNWPEEREDEAVVGDNTIIKIGQANVRGLRGNRKLVEAFIFKQKIDTMIITEPHITELKQVPSILDYTWVAGVGSERSMGIVIYVHKRWANNCK